ncbi:MAG: ABC transporter permease subunit [Candidatus Thermoplasmatota archaeon]|nr:ABC transporter permease subunit [Candidatus Thermoplasmatota archaeon]
MLGEGREGGTPLRRRVLDFLSRRPVIAGWYGGVLTYFILLVLLPTLFVLTFVFTGFPDILSLLRIQPGALGQIGDAVLLSYQVAIVVTLVDLVFGLPLAWFLVRRRVPGKSFVNTLIDLPLAVPTAGLGFSVALFWGVTPLIMAADKPFGALGLVSTGFVILVLLHFTTTFPYMVRALAAILEEIDVEYETAARTAGASRLTAARTVTLPLFRSGLATGAILVLAKALSDTGGVVAALTTIGRFSTDTATCTASGDLNGTALIGAWSALRGLAACQDVAAELTAGLALVAVIMILSAIALLAVVKLLATRARIPFRRIFPIWERRLSRGVAPKVRDLSSFAFLILAVLIPSFFLIGFLLITAPQPTDFSVFYLSIALSFLIAGIATVIDLALGVPMAILIVRRGSLRVRHILDVLVNIPYVVPSAALGISLMLFFTQQRLVPVPSLLFLVILAHVAFTFPFIVRNVVGALEGLDPALEETARSLGAKPLQGFRRVTFPMVKPAILAGAIMAFTRSVGETGATLAVAGGAIITAPVFIVSLLDPLNPNYYAAALATVILIAVSATAMLLMRYLAWRAR